MLFCVKAIDKGNDPIIYGVEYKYTEIEEWLGGKCKITEAVEFYENGRVRVSINYDYIDKPDYQGEPDRTIYCDYSLVESSYDGCMVFLAIPGWVSAYDKFNENQMVLKFSETAKECWLHGKEEYMYKANSNPQLMNWILFGVFTAATIAVATLTVITAKKLKKD